MFSIQSDNCAQFVRIFGIISLCAAALEEPKLGILRNTPHVSAKAAYHKCQIRLSSEISVTIRTFAETEKNRIGVLKNCKKDQKFIF